MQSYLPCPADHTSLDAIQNKVSILHCKDTLLPQVHLAVQQYLRVLFGRAVLHPYILQLLLVVEFAMTQAQDLVLGFAEPREVHLGPVNPQLVIICQALMGSVDIPLPS